VALGLAISPIVSNEVDLTFEIGESNDPIHTPESDIEIRGDNEVRFQHDFDDEQDSDDDTNSETEEKMKTT
jgi:hypothetical protein